MGKPRRPRLVRSLVLAVVIGAFGVVVVWDVFTETHRVSDAWSWVTEKASRASGRLRWELTLTTESRRSARTEAINVGLAKMFSEERMAARPVPFLDTSLEPGDVLHGVSARIELISDAEARRRAVAGYDPDFKYQRYGAFVLGSAEYTWTGIDLWLCRHLYQTKDDVVSSSIDMCLQMHCEPTGDGFHCEIADGWIT